MAVGALGLGWVCGLSLYEAFYPKELEPADAPALNAMIESVIDPESTGNSRTKDEHLDTTGLELKMAPRAAGQNGSAKTASRPGINR